MELVLIIRCLPAFASAPARSRFSFFSKKGAPFPPSPPSLLAARPSWRSQALCFSMKHHRGSGSPELRLQLQDCFCCANKTALGTQDLTCCDFRAVTVTVVY